MKKLNFEAEVIRLLKLILRYLLYVVRTFAANPDNRVERIRISGQRLAQYHEVARLLAERPLMSRYAASKQAFETIKGGFKSHRDLLKYVTRHPVECPKRR